MDSQEGQLNTSDFVDVSHTSNVVPKTDLESLGFVIDNGKPRFKLDEPVSTTFYPKVELSKADSLDDSEILSFVILGKKSLDSIQASSLATYTDIQQKCMSIDYNSIISSLNASEVQQKLAELLQENVKLKETLKQNTVAMKQQFNTLLTWQEEIVNVHKHHKQKFSETRRFIDLLKQENADLKLKLHAINADDTIVSSMKELHRSIPLDQIEGRIPSSLDDLNDSKYNWSKLSKDNEKYVNLSSETNVQLEETTRATEDQSFKTDKPETTCSTDQVIYQVKGINELTGSLEDEIKSLHTSINLNMKQVSNHIISPQSHYFTQSIKQYGGMLQEMTDCFITQIARYSTIQKCIKESTNIIDACESIRLPKQCDMMEEEWSLQLQQLKIYKDKLSNHQKMLLEEQLKLISDRQCFIKIQNQFQKIFSDYNSILYELQMMTEENTKLNIMKDSITKETSQTIIELEKQKNESEQKLKEIKATLEHESQAWNKQKKMFDNLRKSLNMEYKWLIDQKEMLFNLKEEKVLVDKQCQLTESNEEPLQTEKEILEKDDKQLDANMDALYSKLQAQEETIKQLTRLRVEQNEEIIQQKEEIEILREHASCYEEDFHHEKKAKEQLLLEIKELQDRLNRAYISGCFNPEEGF